MNQFVIETMENNLQTGGNKNTQPVYSSFADDPDFAELVEFFVEAIPERCQMLQDSYRQNNTDEVRTIAHQLKGAGGGYGFDGLSEHAARLEQACKDNDVNAVCESIDILLGYMERISV